MPGFGGKTNDHRTEGVTMWKVSLTKEKNLIISFEPINDWLALKLIQGGGGGGGGEGGIKSRPYPKSKFSMKSSSTVETQKVL